MKIKFRGPAEYTSNAALRGGVDAHSIHQQLIRDIAGTVGSGCELTDEQAFVDSISRYCESPIEYMVS